GWRVDASASAVTDRAGRPLYSLTLPVRPGALAPDADDPLATLRERAGAPKVPAALEAAGVRYAFASAGLNDPKDFVKNAARAVKAGLAETDAIRAMTISAATIAGLGDRLGSIEKGKAANLVVADGSIFDDKTKITHVFVEGRRVALDGAPRPATGRGRGRGAHD